MTVQAPASAVPGSKLLGDIRWLLFGRCVPMVLFSLLAWLQWLHLQSALAALGRRQSGGDLAMAALQAWDKGLYFLFCGIPVALYLTRRRPLARDGRPLPRVVAFTGTTILLGVGAMDATPVLIRLGTAGAAFAAVVEACASALAVWGLLYLRRNLSIIPEARAVVSGGPYRWIRHPLYAAEIGVALGMLAVHVSSLLLVAVAVFVVLQLLRARWEERLLSSALPGYAAYQSHTWRLIPLVW